MNGIKDAKAFPVICFLKKETVGFQWFPFLYIRAVKQALHSFVSLKPLWLLFRFTRLHFFPILRRKIPPLLYKGRCLSRSGKAAPLYKITCSSFGRILFLSCFSVFPGFKGLFPP